MFRRLFGLKSAREAPPSTGGRLVYAIGDVHGRLDVLGPLLHDIAKDALAARPAERPLLALLGDYVDRGPDSRGVIDLILQMQADATFEVAALKGNHEEALLQFLEDPAERPLLVLLGDYVDRGPESRGVIDLILQMQADATFEVAALKGNHEEALLQFLDDPAFATTWMEHGGGATLASYGVQPATQRTDVEAWVKVRDAFTAALPPPHLQFYRTLELIRTVGDYAFVHAGVRPGVALEEQAERDLLWIRYEFLNDRGPFDKVIVHGHTPTEEPQVLKHRLGVDTGAYATGVLTAVRLYGEEQRLMQAKVQRRAA